MTSGREYSRTEAGVVVQKDRGRAFTRILTWISFKLRDPHQHRQEHNQSADSRTSRAPSVLLCLIIFSLAFGIRLFFWQDWRIEIAKGEAMMAGLIKTYRNDARRQVEGGGFLIPDAPIDPGDARLIVHPPGYPMLIASLYRDTLLNKAESAADGDGNRYRLLILIQVIASSLGVVFLYLIAGQFLPRAVSGMAGIIAALSPHLAYYSLWLTPDSLAVLPMLAGVYSFSLAVKRQRLMYIVAAGMLFGLSCWFRSNSLLLAPLISLMAVFIFQGRRRWLFPAALTGAAVLVVSPITIRNAVVYHRFIPVTIVSGLNMVEGIGELDAAGEFGMPADDKQAAVKDAEWHQRPDYAINLWVPDGIDRDRARLERGLQVIRSHPQWFLNGMIKRAAFMLSYNDSKEHRWPFNSAVVPLISKEPPFGHDLEEANHAELKWQAAAAELMVTAELLNEKAGLRVIPDAGLLQVLGDDSEFGDQLASELVPTRTDTDYVVKLTAVTSRGRGAVKITGPDMRIAAGSQPLNARSAEPVNGEPVTTLMPFSSGRRKAVRVVLSNDGICGSVIDVGKFELLEIGPTPWAWSRYPRELFRGIEKNLYTTGRMPVLLAAGIILMGFAKRWRALAVLLAVPAYYLILHSPFSTEYRYILAIHHFLFVTAAVGIYVLGGALLALLQHAAEMARSTKFSVRDWAGREKSAP